MYVVAVALLLLPLVSACGAATASHDGAVPPDASSAALLKYAAPTTSVTGAVITTTTLPATGPSTDTTDTTGEAGGTTTTATTEVTDGIVTTPTTDAATETTAATVAATGEPADGAVLYEIDTWSEGVSGWAAAGQWTTIGGMLVTDGSSNSFAVAPVELDGQTNYVVECEIRLLDAAVTADVYLMARMTNGVGFWAGYNGANSRMVIGHGTDTIVDTAFVLDDEWHTYRFELIDNNLRLFFEQAEVARAADNRAVEPGTVGVYCGNGQISIRSFRVIAL